MTFSFWIGIANNKSFFKVSQKELKSIFKQFKRETPNGSISHEEFKEAMNLMGVVDPILQNLVFKVFVKGDDQRINFSEFVSALSIMTRGTPEEKLKCKCFE